MRRTLLPLAGLCGALGLLTLSCIGCASSGLSRGLQIGVVTTAVLDLHSTSVALGSDLGLVEANPLMRGSDAKRAAMKAIAASSTVWMGAKWERDHPTATRFLMAFASGLWGWAAVHNYRLITQVTP